MHSEKVTIHDLKLDTSKDYRIQYDMLGSNGIVTITIDKKYEYDEAVLYLKNNIDWMKSARILKVHEIVVGEFNESSFKVVKK